MTLALGVAVVLVAYGIGFRPPQGPWILATNGTVLPLSNGSPGTVFVFGVHGRAGHLTGNWSSNAPVLTLYCPVGTNCTFLLPRDPAACGQTIDLYFPPEAYSMSLSSFSFRSTNVTFASDLVYTLLPGPLGSDIIVSGPSNLAHGCTAT